MVWHVCSGAASESVNQTKATAAVDIDIILQGFCVVASHGGLLSRKLGRICWLHHQNPEPYIVQVWLMLLVFLFFIFTLDAILVPLILPQQTCWYLGKRQMLALCTSHGCSLADVRFRQTRPSSQLLFALTKLENSEVRQPGLWGAQSASLTKITSIT